MTDAKKQKLCKWRFLFLSRSVDEVCTPLSDCNIKTGATCSADADGNEITSCATPYDACSYIPTVVLVQATDRRRARRKAGLASWVSKVPRRSQETTVVTPPTDKQEDYWKVLGVPLTPDFSAVGLAYFAQGALALAALAKPFYVKDTLGLSPAEATTFLSLTYWPWIMKPLWGFIADSVPIFGSRRQAYLVLSGAISVIGWLGLAGWWPVEVSKE
eukprot:symbB.v1.2.039431.t1/scaffold6559.1/size17080/1